MKLAVFTKNRTNPAYEAARIGADRTAKRLGAMTAHYVPDIPDDVGQQIALIDRAIAGGFLPPAPREEACARCDFHLVCGPHEEERARRKDALPLAALVALRQRP